MIKPIVCGPCNRRKGDYHNGPHFCGQLHILYLALASVWAPVDTAASGEQAAEAAQKADKNQGASS
jgi:hypothetical protein